MIEQAPNLDSNRPKEPFNKLDTFSDPDIAFEEHLKELQADEHYAQILEKYPMAKSACLGIKNKFLKMPSLKNDPNQFGSDFLEAMKKALDDYESGIKKNLENIQNSN